MKKNKIIQNLIILTAFFLSTFVQADPASLNVGTIRMNINGQSYIFSGAKGGIEKKQGKYKIYIGLKDRIRHVKIVITAEIDEQKPLKQMYLSSSYNNVMFIFKKSDMGYFSIMPSVSEIKKSISYRQKGKNKKRKKALWKNLSRFEKIKRGKGIARIKAMQGSVLYLNITPVYKNGVLSEFQGSFSGLLSASASALKSAGDVKINKGEFRIRLSK